MFRALFNLDRKSELVRAIDQGALILDVRTQAEFATGHVPGSMNIPVDALREQVSTLDRRTPIITCCKSGMRSLKAAQLLVDHGFAVQNGGAWEVVRGLKRSVSTTK